MQNPLFTQASLAASGTTAQSPLIPLIRTRTLSITTRATFGGSIDANATLNVYFSPDGKNYDTSVYTSIAIPYTAGGTVQKTVQVDPPEHGYIMLTLTNGSSADEITDIKLWYSIESWAFATPHSKADISTKSEKD